MNVILQLLRLSSSRDSGTLTKKVIDDSHEKQSPQKERWIPRNSQWDVKPLFGALQVSVTCSEETEMPGLDCEQSIGIA
jgi:hypothetical protein